MNRTARLSILLSIFVMLYCGPAHLFAQKSRAAAGKKLAAKKRDPRAIVSAWDKNKDGMLQPAEIPAAARGKVLSSAKARGLDPKKPIKIEALFAKGGEKASKKLDRGLKKSQESKEAKESSSEDNVSNAKAFGRSAAARKKAAGFKSSESSREDGDETPKDKKAGDDESKKLRAARKRLAPIAKSMMFQHDKNRNGRLEKSEWKGLSGEPWLSDKDRDGALSMSELTDHLGGFGSREKDVTARSRAKKKSRKSSVGKDGKKLSYRFLSPHERLPKELPAWWVELDGNEDGQLTMREFASTMSPSKVEKFMQLDLNRDGMLVAKEYLKATE